MFRLKGLHQVEHKNKDTYKHFMWNWDLESSQFILLCGYTYE
jgi:hypothetical protein